MDTLNKWFANTLFIALAAPIAFLHWLFSNGEFGAGKAVIFVVVMFLFGSAFFLN